MSRKRGSWRTVERTYKSITADLERKAVESIRSNKIQEPIKAALLELEQLHSAAHCPDEGPNTCPTWAAIYGLRTLLDGKSGTGDPIQGCCFAGVGQACPIHEKR